MSGEWSLDDAKRRLNVEQAVRDFLHILDQQGLTMEEGLVAWNMLGFTMFQDIYPDASHAEVQQHMQNFSEQLFASAQPTA